MYAKAKVFRMRISLVLCLVFAVTSIAIGQSSLDPFKRMAQIRVAGTEQGQAAAMRLADDLQADCASGKLNCPSLMLGELLEHKWPKEDQIQQSIT
jgi:hypothetical protein